MKKWKMLAFVGAFIVLISSIAFGVHVSASAENLGYYSVYLEFNSNIFEISSLSYTIDGINVDYSSDGFKPDGEDALYNYRVTYNGTPGGLGLMTGEARVEYLNTQPFADYFTDNYGVDNCLLPVEPQTDVTYTLDFRSESLYKNYYLSQLAYKVGTSGNYYTIDTTKVDKFGDASFESEYNEELGCYTQTINTVYTFNYNFNINKAETIYQHSMVVKSVPSDMTVRTTGTTKAQGITFTGASASIGDSNRKYFSYTDNAEITITPEDGEIIDEVTLYLGDTRIITLYGGMQTGGVYTFKDGLVPEKYVGYGNFALAYESDLDYIASESDGNYAKLVVNNLVEVEPEVDPEDPDAELEPVYEERELEDYERFEITINDSGVVTMSSSLVPMWITVDITTQKYVQVDLELVADGVAEFTSEPYSEVILGDVTYTENIPSRIFVVGFDETIAVRVGLNENYNFTDDMNPLLIEGSYFVHGAFPGGKIEISALKEDAYTINVLLYKDGVLFTDSATKIYLSTRDDVQASTDFTASEVSAVSSEGKATIRNVDAGTKLKIYIEVGHYYNLIVDDVRHPNNYLNLDFEVSTNHNIIIYVEYFEVERPVMFEDTQIGSIKITLLQVTSQETEDGFSVYATYNATYKGLSEDSYSAIRLTNPYVYGYNLVNMSVAGVDLLTKFSDDTFGVDAEDAHLHQFLASDVFDSDVVARFTEKKNEFSFIYNGTIYEGVSYYGREEMFLEVPVEILEEGMYFGGLYYYAGSDKIELLTIEDQTPVLIEEGEFAGMTKYLLSTPWSLDDSGMLLDILVLPFTYTISWVFTEDEVTHTTITEDIKYGTEFSVRDFIADGMSDPILEDGYNLIGWNIEMDEEVLFIKADECEYTYYNTFVFEWLSDVRFVPVFSAGTSMLTIHLPGDIILSHSIKYDEVTNLEKILKIADEWQVVELFGYNFIGFYDQVTVAGSKVIDYTGEELPYAFMFEANPDYFSKEGEVYVWTLLKNLDLYAVYEAIEYSLDLTIINPEMLAGDPESSVGTLEKLANGSYYLSNFTMNSTINLSKLTPKVNHFLSKIDIVINLDDGSTINVETSFGASCDKNGEVVVYTDDGRFSLDNHTLNLIVSDFVNIDTKGVGLDVTIEYTAITYIVSFKANLVNDKGEVLQEDSSEVYYYQMTVENAKIQNASSWVRVTETGEVFGLPGWYNIYTPTTHIAFTKNTLYGISGLSYEHNGVTYSFKAWNDFSQNVTLTPETVIDKSYDFVSMFSDKYDVTVNYYIYNDTSDNYIKHGVDGYFWSYDVLGSTYYLENPRLANAYEIYLVNGDLYYIDQWSDTKITTFGQLPDGANVYELMSELSVDYKATAIELNFYAVYVEYGFELESGAENYSVTASLPNDPNGNDYTSEDILWVVVDKVRYDAYAETALSISDKLNLILGTGDAIGLATIQTGDTLEKSVAVGESNYLFAVIQRKVEGKKQNSFYVALQVI